MQTAIGGPAPQAVAASRRRTEDWFAQTAPLLRWGTFETPLGLFYAAVSEDGLAYTDFGIEQDVFMARLDPLARSVRDDAALAGLAGQLSEYFAGRRGRFDLPLDMSRMRPFQQRVLAAALGIPAGVVWTYGQLAQFIGEPQASRAVGRALGTNPIPLVIPCHRVIGSDGKLHGYGAGAGLPTKRWLLELEGAL
ncbi:MAG: methylated-DNA--[protein]-cysteine S-methyltransferase [Anaerolineae bacterium]|nr:methylated-DNA--[protein]-cysteine S-methyltransferase [Anaerolineae bacterium]